MITLLNQSIFDQDVDVIVNAANGHLRHGGGLARMIEDRATAMPPQYDPMNAPRASRSYFRDYLEAVDQWEDDHAAAPLIATGDAYATSAGNLPNKAVIHAVGPIWGGGQFFERELLFNAYVSSMRVLNDLQLHSVAFPAISAGIFRAPMQEVARQAIIALSARPQDIRVCLTNDDDLLTWVETADALGTHYRLDIPTDTQ